MSNRMVKALAPPRLRGSCRRRDRTAGGLTRRAPRGYGLSRVLETSTRGPPAASSSCLGLAGALARDIRRSRPARSPVAPEETTGVAETSDELGEDVVRTSSRTTTRSRCPARRVLRRRPAVWGVSLGITSEVRGSSCWCDTLAALGRCVPRPRNCSASGRKRAGRLASSRCSSRRASKSPRTRYQAGRFRGHRGPDSRGGGHGHSQR